MNVATKIGSAGSGYHDDFALWSAEQAELMRAGRLDVLDLENVAEEIESLGKSQRSTIRSHFAVIVEHLLKLRHSPAREPRNGWRDSVRNARDQIEFELMDSPSLRRALPQLLDQAHRIGRSRAIRALSEHGEVDRAHATQLDAEVLTLDQALNELPPFE